MIPSSSIPATTKSPLKRRPYSKTLCKRRAEISSGSSRTRKVLHEKRQEASNKVATSLIYPKRKFPSACIMLAGDFNQLDLGNLSRRYNLQQLVQRSTRGKNILDQIITNMSGIYNKAVHLPPLGKSDHHCLLLPPKTQAKVKPTSRNARAMHPRNIAALTMRLNEHNWNEVLNARDIDRKVEIFTRQMTTILDETMPVKKMRMHPSDKPWLSPHIKSVIKDRQRAYTNGDVQKYQQLRF